MAAGRSGLRGFGTASPRVQREAELFYADLVGRTPGRGALEEAEAEATPPPEWLAIAQRLPVTYTRQQMPMEQRILGVVVHTTNHGAGEETLARFQRDWQAAQFQSAHFAVDRAGNIGQYRSTREVAWHINEPSVRYFGIEHIAQHMQELTPAQIERSARLIGDLAVLFGFPAQRLTAAGGTGIGIHVDFRPTGCGQNVFWTGTAGQRTASFDRLVTRAHDFATLGF
jgi:N-acetyl-anhydromuramyl-L-alanine amidase AmpD